jgi:hypothetical protein
MAVIAVCLAAWSCINTAHEGGLALYERLNWHEGVWCVCRLAVLSVPATIIGFGILMRRGAPADLAGTSLAVGIGAAAWGAFVFVFSCPYDDPLYTAVWFSVEMWSGYRGGKTASAPADALVIRAGVCAMR